MGQVALALGGCVVVAVHLVLIRIHLRRTYDI